MKRILPVIFCFLMTFSTQAQEEPAPDKLTEAARAMKEKKYREAEIIYRDLLKKDREDIAVQQFLCQALIFQEKFNEADSMLRRMVERDSNNGGNYWYMGLSAERQKQDSLAVYWFKYHLLKTENLPQQNIKAWLRVGSAYRRLMHDTGITLVQVNDMIYHYEQYLKLYPAEPYAPDLRAFIALVATKKPSGNDRLKWDEQN